MKQKRWIALGVLALATTAAFFAHAQTIGGDLALNSKTWTWTGLTADLPSTALFTPTADGDFLVTAYVSINPAVSSNVCIQPTLHFTDQYASQLGSFVFNGGANIVSAGGGTGGIGQGAATAIHVKANTAVTVSAAIDACSQGGTGTYDLVISKTKLNP